ncbi:MAG: hypothetical protein BHW00_07550 [Clostridium sp. 26_22]|nr:MAG: hypothetical protein BHW00_07550 [Clostridium sp. 26_22]
MNIGIDIDNVISNFNEALKEDGHMIVIITGRDNGNYADPWNMTENWLKQKEIKYDKLIITDAYEFIKNYKKIRH